MRDYAEQQRRLLGEIATFSARNLAILAGLSPATLANSSNAVNTSVSTAQPYSQPLEANISVTNTAESNPDSASTSCQLSSLTLSHTVARSETLESPADVPSSLSILPNDVTVTQVSEVISCDKQQVGTDIEPKNDVQTSSDAFQSPNAVASISIESETAAVISNVSAYEKLMPAPQATAGKPSKFAAVRRRFTVSKTVLPSSAAPPVVVFSKLAAESVNPSEVQTVDDVGCVHIVDKAQSPVCDIDPSLGSANVSPALEAVTHLLTAADSAQESTVIVTDELCVDETDEGDEEVGSESHEARACDPHLAQSTDVQIVVCGENVDDQLSDRCCDGTTDENVEVHSDLCVQQSEVTVGSCAVSECPDVETSTLSCESGYQINVEDGSQQKDAAEWHDITTTGNKFGIVPASALQEGCPTAVDYTTSECRSELNSLQCTADELPFSDASDDILVAQVIDSVTSCSTVQQMTASVSSAASLLLCNKHDASQQSEQCDNNPDSAESMPSVPATQCSRPMQDETDDKC